ncbi:alkaline phosphatase D family protein [Nannocystis punicea]|uniref:Alkaline phosphatase D family protein n=1 Tax=Nannocystis punicea TaxID=2995304 RepID=A0ABY7GYE7_9BACT|nr:alkaline phosphatase D family protein [Nannocystis poenicansa]WAS92006.1 alkaline phosphatase D family protein [Nannocystis poenicansa]
MSTLRPPGLGPIVGHTTDRSCRLWMQAATLDDPRKIVADEDRRTVGVLVVMQKGEHVIPAPVRPVFYFRLQREFDRTGTFILGLEAGLGGTTPVYALEPDTTYRVRLASLALDDAEDNELRAGDQELAATLPNPQVWAAQAERLPDVACEAVFRTCSPRSAAAPAFSFMLGSCRYPGLMWKIKESDRIFGPMFDELAAEKLGARPSLVVMCGDQIYADAFHRAVPVGLADTHAEFTDRYQQAFGSFNMRRLLRHVPTYMCLDDHEIEDNWSQDRLKKTGKKILFNLAIGSYMSYQWSHSPRNYGKRLYYSFVSSGYPFFALDCRTQRYMDDVPDTVDDNHMLGRPSLDPDEPSQLDVLCQWLRDQQADRGNVPKFIISSSVFAPNPVFAINGASVAHLEKTDAWPAFPHTRRVLLQTIVDSKIQNVVFLSGDVHSASVARLDFSGDGSEALRAYSLVSSAFYWPFPFADGDPAEFVHDSRDPRTPDTFEIRPGVTMDYRAWNFCNDDNFARITAERASHTLTMELIGRDGAPIRTKGPYKKDVDLTSRLDLAPW